VGSARGGIDTRADAVHATEREWASVARGAGVASFEHGGRFRADALCSAIRSPISAEVTRGRRVARRALCAGAAGLTFSQIGTAVERGVRILVTVGAARTLTRAARRLSARQHSVARRRDDAAREPGGAELSVVADVRARLAIPRGARAGPHMRGGRGPGVADEIALATHHRIGGQVTRAALRGVHDRRDGHAHLHGAVTEAARATNALTAAAGLAYLQGHGTAAARGGASGAGSRSALAAEGTRLASLAIAADQALGDDAHQRIGARDLSQNRHARFEVLDRPARTRREVVGGAGIGVAAAGGCRCARRGRGTKRSSVALGIDDGEARLFRRHRPCCIAVLGEGAIRSAG